MKHLLFTIACLLMGVICSGQSGNSDLDSLDYATAILEMPMNSKAYLDYSKRMQDEAIAYTLYKANINRSTLVDKLVRISSNTYQYDVDAIALLQLATKEAVQECPTYVASTLSKMSNWQIRNFWLFIFSGMYPDSSFLKCVQKEKSYAPYKSEIIGAFSYNIAIWVERGEPI